MRSLFAKTLLAFVLANVIVGGAGVVLSQSLQTDPRALMLAPLLANYGRAIAALLEANRAGDAADLLADLRDRAGVQAFLFDAQGSEATNRDAPPDLRALAAAALAAGGPRSELGVMRSIVAVPLAHPTRRAAIAAVLPLPPLRHVLARPDVWAPRVAFAVAAAALVCYAFSAYLVSPVRKLQAAAQRIARGDFDARAGAAVGRRRDEIGRLAQDFDRMAARVESLVAEQRRLFRHASHELRSPLARLQIAVGLLRRKQDDPLFDRVEQECERLNHLIDQLLALARLQGAAALGPPAQLDFAGLLIAIAADAEFEGRARNVSVKVHLASPLPVHGYEEVLRSAIENVVRNAVRHTAGGTTVELHVDRSADGGQVDLCVQDRGAGVPAEQLEAIFAPFFRRGDGGIGGLGLTIARRGVELHRGRIWAESSPTGGLRVRIALPIEAECGDHGV